MKKKKVWLALLLAMGLACSSVALASCGSKGDNSSNSSGATSEGDKEYFNVPLLLDDIRDENKTYNLANRTMPLVLNFWYVTSRDCLVEMPVLNELYESYNGAVEMVALHSATMYDQAIATEFVDLYVDGNGLAWKDYSIGFAMDVKLGDATLYDILGGNDTWPMTVVLGSDGEILYRAHGCLTENDLGKMRSILNSELSIEDETTDDESSDGGSSDDESVDGEIVCTVTVQSEGGMRMSGVTVVATDKAGNAVEEVEVGANGKAILNLANGEYGITLKDLPLGYYQTTFGQKVSSRNPDISITLGIELVEESDRPAGFKY